MQFEWNVGGDQLLGVDSLGALLAARAADVMGCGLLFSDCRFDVLVEQIRSVDVATVMDRCLDRFGLDHGDDVRVDRWLRDRSNLR